MIALDTLPQPTAPCPVCAGALQLDGWSMPGMRALAQARCMSCDRRYYADLPVGQALYSPMLLDAESGDVHDPTGVAWYAAWLRDAYAARRYDPVPSLHVEHRRPISRPVVLLNCLDTLYGHCLLKLLNAQQYLDAGACDVIVIVQPFLQDLVPDGVAECWTVDLPLRLGTVWSDTLAARIADEVDRIGDVSLAPAHSHPHPSTFAIERFSRVAPFPLHEWRTRRATVTFVWRDDRVWRPRKASPLSRLGLQVGYPGRPDHDERDQARSFATTLGIDFHEVELAPGEMVDAFPGLNAARDDPIADIAGFGYFAVMRAAHDRGVPVMLQGQGGDELFWGYDSLRQARHDALLKQRDRARGITALRTAAGLRHGLAEFQRRLRSPRDLMPFYDRSPDYRDADRNIAGYYEADFRDQIEDVDPALLFTFQQPWPDIEVTLTERVCATYLRENGIAQGDRLAMASSVELRLPFMDHRFVETVIGLRRSRPDGALGYKAWLSAAAADVVPVEVRMRPKQGFAPPVREWHAALFARYGAGLTGGFLQTAGILSPSGAARLALGDYPSDTVAPLSFKALVLEHWCRQMADIQSAQSTPSTPQRP